MTPGQVDSCLLSAGFSKGPFATIKKVCACDQHVLTVTALSCTTFLLHDGNTSNHAFRVELWFVLIVNTCTHVCVYKGKVQ